VVLFELGLFSPDLLWSKPVNVGRPASDRIAPTQPNQLDHIGSSAQLKREHKCKKYPRSRKTNREGRLEHAKHGMRLLRICCPQGSA
jgi:hypothetical protein